MKTLFLAALLVACSSIFAATEQQDILALNHKISSAHAASEPVVNPRLVIMQKEISRLDHIRNSGGWGIIPITPKKIYRQGDSNNTIKALKKRLYTSGDMEFIDTSSLYNKELVAVVKKVQKRHGFKEDGLVFTEFLKELNVPVEKRIHQLKININRLEKMEITSGTRLVANIPEFKLHVYEGDQHIFDMPIVVGKSSSKTISFNDQMKHVVFSPYWNVPSSIVSAEILPAMDRDRTYLKRNGYEQVGSENGLPKIRQKPGKNNSLGLVKFIFPNSHNIYFHDTPAKSLFQARKRTFSHGCIRLAEPEKLARYLLKDQNWDDARIKKAMHAGKEQWVALDKPVAVSITYITAWVGNDGEINFREDVYGHDK
jgi:murein L,D-transpeptidase YcbB/YkuD